jgi:hypothetical protein
MAALSVETWDSYRMRIMYRVLKQPARSGFSDTRSVTPLAWIASTYMRFNLRSRAVVKVISKLMESKYTGVALDQRDIEQKQAE